MLNSAALEHHKTIISLMLRLAKQQQSGPLRACKMLALQQARTVAGTVPLEAVTSGTGREHRCNDKMAWCAEALAIQDILQATLLRQH